MRAANAELDCSSHCHNALDTALAAALATVPAGALSTVPMHKIRQRQNRARCAFWPASEHRAKDSAPPRSLGLAEIARELEISKSTPRDPEFEDPVVVFKIERAFCQVGTPDEPSATDGSFRRGFACFARFSQGSCLIRSS